jgi:biopolymer transport protein ExbD
MRKRKANPDAKLEMTPMIDVVFQLLIFFIVTLKTPDILAHLDVSRPEPSKVPPPIDIPLLTIQIGAEGCILNGNAYSGPTAFADMQRHLAKFASYSQNASVMIKCTADAPHAYLIQTLNACAAEGMDNISLFSL